MSSRFYDGPEPKDLPASQLTGAERAKKNIKEGWWQNMTPEELAALAKNPAAPFDDHAFPYQERKKYK